MLEFEISVMLILLLYIVNTQLLKIKLNGLFNIGGKA